MASQRPLVFISCGEATEEERVLGAEVESLVEKLLSARTYRARREGTLNSRATEIVQHLHEAAGYIVILPKRETLSDRNGNPKGPRTSVWVEQELAIAHYCHLHVSPRRTMVFAHSEVFTEGLRGDLKLNPIPYTTSNEVLAALRDKLPGWLNGAVSAALEPLVAGLELELLASGGGRDEEWGLRPTVSNPRNSLIQKWRLELLIPEPLRPSVRAPHKHEQLLQANEPGLKYRKLQITERFGQLGATQDIHPRSTAGGMPSVRVHVPTSPGRGWEQVRQWEVVLRTACEPDWQVHEVRRSLHDLNTVERNA